MPTTNIVTVFEFVDDNSGESAFTIDQSKLLSVQQRIC
jgi:hypothetical protein